MMLVRDIAVRTLECSALLFDMDGTLVDSTAVSERLWRDWALAQGTDADDVLAWSHGRRTIDTIGRFLANGDPVIEAGRFEEAELSERDGTVAVAGARQLLARLPSDRWAIVTSAGRALARHRLTLAGLPIPRVLIAAEDVVIGKPDPQGYLAAAALLGVAPADCIVFEDTFAGHEAAARGGMRSIDRHAVPHAHTLPVLIRQAMRD